MVMTPPGRKTRPEGGAAAPRVLRLGDTTPERLDIELNNRQLKGWVCTNQRYPASIAAELEDARQKYLNAREVVFDGPPPPDIVDSVRDLLVDWPDEGVPSSATLQMHKLRFEAAIKLVDDGGPRYRAHASDWENYITTCLMILVPGLESWETDLLPAQVRMEVLYELGYFQKPTQTDAPEGDGQRPPDAAGSSTGDAPKPDSPASIT